MQILSIQVGKPRTVEFRGKSVTTSIFKEPVLGPVLMRTLNIEGDEQADLKVHGGLDKAVYAYSCDAYGHWKMLRPTDSFPFGAMGENLSVESLLEDQIFIGDTFELGEAVIQVTQPRFPCFKLGVKYNDPGILKQFMTLNRPGVYFRCLKEGLIDRGHVLKLVSQESLLVSISEIFEINQAQADPTRVREILKLKSLNQSWRKKLESWV